MKQCEKCRGFGFVINGTGMPYANGQEVKVNLECLECGGSGMSEQPKQDKPKTISNREALRQVAETTENLEQEIAECVTAEARATMIAGDEMDLRWCFAELNKVYRHLRETEPSRRWDVDEPVLMLHDGGWGYAHINSFSSGEDYCHFEVEWDKWGEMVPAIRAKVEAYLTAIKDKQA